MTTAASQPPPGVDVIYPHSPSAVADVVPFAGLVADGRAGRLWFGQSLRLDSAHVAAALAGRGLAVPIGTAVSLMAFRPPYAAAAEARSLAAVTGHGVVAGFGVGAPEVAAAFTGRPQADPVRYARAYVDAVRELLDGRAVQRADEPLPMTCRLLPWLALGTVPPPDAGAAVEVGLAALRPRMARAAGEVADVVVTWLTPPQYLAQVLVPAVREGAAARARPSRCRVVAVVHVALRRPGRDVRHVVRTGTAAHVATPTYAGMLRRAGLDVREDAAGAAAGVLLDAGVVAAGSVDEAVATVDRYTAAGVDTVVLDTSGVLASLGVRAAMEDLRELLDALADPVRHGTPPIGRTTSGPGTDRRRERTT